MISALRQAWLTETASSNISTPGIERTPLAVTAFRMARSSTTRYSRGTSAGSTTRKDHFLLCLKPHALFRPTPSHDPAGDCGSNLALLFETVEAYRRIGQAIYEQWRAGQVQTIYDFACGHGLLGVLLAGRFPKLQVVCVDLERRPAFDHYLEVARELGLALSNLAGLEADFRKMRLPPKSYVICIHACNEATRAALEMAVAANACYAAMPCCIRDGIYLRHINHVDERVRYATAVGVIAGQFGAYKITAVDERITNRNLIVLGAPQPAAG
jgi:hypothetical protein